jgi:hypothetical protein
MKKLLFLMVVGFGGAMLVKGGHVTITPENQVKVANYTLPIPAAVQNSPVFGMVTTLFMGQLGPTAEATAAPGRTGTPGVPSMSNVSAAAGSYNSSGGRTGAPAAPSAASDQLTAVAKALR